MGLMNLLEYTSSMTMFLGIFLLFCVLLYYIRSKIYECERKVSSVMGLVTAMANELSEIKNPSLSNETVHNITLERTVVSDNESGYETDSSAEESDDEEDSDDESEGENQDNDEKSEVDENIEELVVSPHPSMDGKSTNTTFNEEEVNELDTIDETDSGDSIKNIELDLEKETIEAMKTDYSKLTLKSLREIVAQKNLVDDVSQLPKLKKGDLLALLQ